MSAVYKRPESVLVVIYTAAGEVLLLRRRAPSDFWQSVTGSLEWGEQPEAAARRELQEETGLGPEFRPRSTGRKQRFAILPAWRKRYAPDVTENTEHTFVLRLAQRTPIRLDPAEHREYVWLPYAAAMQQVSSWTNRAAIEELMTGEGSDHGAG